MGLRRLKVGDPFQAQICEARTDTLQTAQHIRLRLEVLSSCFQIKKRWSEPVEFNAMN